ncbi:ATP-binding protein [Streptomyces sp. AC512_CC834]|uniref:ATP-binding protein n=1 Tax=Streptomyces sp. AC512_CC834 TaxID=2823691 RepID=UPI001C25A7FF|nr:ATP-binding protein [Streptomyces sp. AC512_CC834]
MKSSNVSAEPPTRTPQFTIRLSSTRRGARLARRLAGQQLAAWGIPYDSETSQAVALVTAELAANAITHGRTPGRDFRLTLLLPPEHGVVRVEVTDTRPGRLPRDPTAEPPAPDAPSGLVANPVAGGVWTVCPGRSATSAACRRDRLSSRRSSNTCSDTP